MANNKMIPLGELQVKTLQTKFGYKHLILPIDNGDFE